MANDVATKIRSSEALPKEGAVVVFPCGIASGNVKTVSGQYPMGGTDTTWYNKLDTRFDDVVYYE